MKQTLFKNGTIVHADRIAKDDIIIQGDKILDVGTNLDIGQNADTIDCTNKYIFPGVIDPHTHMGIPIKGGYSSDDFDTGTRSALNGGVTTIIDFTILKHDQSLQDSVNERLKLAEKSHSDFSLHCNITRFHDSLLDEIPYLIEKGINSFKVFTTYKEAGMMLSYSEIKQVAKVIKKYNGILMVHAEDDKIVQSAATPLIEQNHTEPYFHGISRPVLAEETAVKHLVEIAEETKCTIYIVHLNSAVGFHAASKSSFIKIETCPHYLLLDESVYRRNDGRMFVASPPLRTPSDSKILWDGIFNNQIHTLGTDHCPFCFKDKQVSIPFQDIPNGMGGVETLFPVLAAHWINNQFDLTKLVELTSLNPAKLFGLYPRKGAIKPGTDADILILDPKDIQMDWNDKLVSITDWNAFYNFPALFPQQVWLRGELVTQDSLESSTPRGEFIPGVINI